MDRRTCEGYASASIASYYGGRGPWCGNQIGIAPSSTQISGNDQCARSSGNGEPCPYNFESQCGYIYDRGDWRLRVGLAVLAIPDHTAGYAPHSPWFSTTRYSGKCFRSYFGRSGRRVADVRDIGRGVRAQSQQPETNVVFASIVGEGLISEGLGALSCRVRSL